VAQLLNVSPQAVSKWERGESLPDIQTLIFISKLYSVSIDEILAGERNTTSKTDKVKVKHKRDLKGLIAPIVGASFAVLMFLLFIWVRVDFSSGSFSYESVNIYQLVFTDINSYSNVLLLLIFLSNIAILAVSGIMFAPLALIQRRK